jgi:hypothetical protein
MSEKSLAEYAELIVRETLRISKRHWVEHGTPIKPEEYAVVTIDVLAALARDSAVTKAK